MELINFHAHIYCGLFRKVARELTLTAVFELGIAIYDSRALGRLRGALSSWELLRNGRLWGNTRVPGLLEGVLII